MDQYLSDDKVIDRLVREWLQYDKIVVAYDFDNTVYDYHGEDHTYEDVIKLLREVKELGAHLIVFTASPEEKYPFIREYLTSNRIPFDAINEDPPFVPVKAGRKIYFNILLDDRAGLSSAYQSLKQVVEIIKHEGGVEV